MEKERANRPFFLFAIEFSYNLSMFADSNSLGLWQLLEKSERNLFSL